MLCDVTEFPGSGASLQLHRPPPDCMDTSSLKSGSLSCLCNAENNSQLLSENYQHSSWRIKNPFKIMMRGKKSQGKILSFLTSARTSSAMFYLSTLGCPESFIGHVSGQSMNSNHMHKTCPQGFPGCSVVKNPPAIAGDMGLIPGLGRSHILQSNQAREPQLLSLCPRDQEPQLMGPHASTTEVLAP